jgi:hypothetical protein
MTLKIITLYCLTVSLLEAVGYQDDKRAVLSSAEILTIALVASEFFAGNQQNALHFLVEHGYIPPFSKSRFNRRLHNIPTDILLLLFSVLAEIKKQGNTDNTYLTDTVPVPVCHNIRIYRCKIYKGKEYRGYCASKKQYYYGLKVCLIVTQEGIPVEINFTPASYADIVSLREMAIDLPEASILYGDSGFLDRPFEKILKETSGIDLVVPRRNNMKEQLDGCLQYLCCLARKRVETTFSELTTRFGHHLHCVTSQGFEIKVLMTIMAITLLH